MDKLKELLGDLYEQVQTKLGNTKIIIDDGTPENPKWIPAHRLSEITAEKKALAEQIKQHEADMKALKEKAAGNEALTKQITDMQSANEALKKDFDSNQVKIKKEYALKESLMNSGVNKEEYRNLLSKEFDVTKIELDEKGAIKGWAELIKPIKDTYSPMFGETKIAGQPHNKGGDNPSSFFTRDEVLAMDEKTVAQNLEKINKSMETW